MRTTSKTQTQKLAKELAKKILKKNPSTGSGRGATVIALQGDLGAGKTTFVQGFMKALGVKQHVTSPTFVIFRKYHLSEKRKAPPAERAGKSEKFLNVYHFDLYRIHDPKEILDLGWKRIMDDSHAIALIEWPERIKKLIPKHALRIYFEHGKSEKERIIKVISK